MATKKKTTNRSKALVPAFILTIAILTGSLAQVACGPADYAREFRLGLAVSTAFIDSLNLGDKKAAVVADFTELASNAADMGDEIKVCGSDRPCKLVAVNKFQIRFFDVLRHGHFKLSPKLERIQTILTAIVSAAKIYYGDGSMSADKVGGMSNEKAAEAELKARLKELKEATR